MDNIEVLNRTNGRISKFPLTAQMIPMAVANQHKTDPAAAWPGAPPNFGQEDLPHIFSFVGRYGMVANAYQQGDEALLHNSQNAEIMRNEPMIMECIEARMRCVALLNWHIQPIDNDVLRESLDSVADQEAALSIRRALRKPKSDAELLADKLTSIIKHTPSFMRMRYSLMDAIWYGKYGSVQTFGTRNIGGRRRIFCRKWEPRHGDKLMFRYGDETGEFDPDQVGIRVGPVNEIHTSWKDFAGNERQRVEPTQHGLVQWLDGQQRRRMCVHKHIIEDADFNRPEKAGSIHGVGIRSRIYWTWWAYQECLKLLLEYLERSALGIEIWKYPAHNPQAKSRVEAAAKDRQSPGRSAILVPVEQGEYGDMYGVEIVEPGLGGLQELESVLSRFFGHKIKRYILGQVLTSEAEATGMGSGVADAHLATFHDIVRFDGLNLEETLTNDFLRNLQSWNFPGTDDIYLQFKINTESPDAVEKMASYQHAWSMGLKIRTEDIYDSIGAAPPADGEDYIQNPAFIQQPQPEPMMFGPFPGNPLGGDGGSGDISGEQGGAQMDQYALHNVYTLNKSSVETPSKEQIAAGNYRKGHIKLHGFDITIENVKGSKRRPEWPALSAHYGYIKRTTGRDGDHVDVFIGPQPYSELVAVIDQETAGGRFDEHKVIMGITSEEQAKRLYLANFASNWRCGPITMMTVSQFRNWLDGGNTTKRVGRQVSQYSQAGKEIQTNLADHHHSALGDWLQQVEKKKGAGVPVNVEKNYGIKPDHPLTHDDQHLILFHAGYLDHPAVSKRIFGEQYAGHEHSVPDMPLGKFLVKASRGIREAGNEATRQQALKRAENARVVSFKHDSGHRLILHPAVRKDAGGSHWQLSRLGRDKVPLGHSNPKSFQDGLFGAVGAHPSDHLENEHGYQIEWTDKDGTKAPFSATGDHWLDVERYAQLAFNWDEGEHPRESESHDDKKPGEFAPKKQGEPESVEARQARAMAILGGPDGHKHHRKVSATMLYTGTDAHDWKATPISHFQDAETPHGTRPMPIFEHPQDYKQAKTPFTSQNGDCCELCGKNIKNVYHIQNDKHKLTMAVGSECVGHFGEGVSGEKHVKQSATDLQRKLIDHAHGTMKDLWQHGHEEYDDPFYQDGKRWSNMKKRWKRPADWRQSKTDTQQHYEAIKEALQHTGGQINNLRHHYGDKELIWNDRQVANWHKKNGAKLEQALQAAIEHLKANGVETESHRLDAEIERYAQLLMQFPEDKKPPKAAPEPEDDLDDANLTPFARKLKKYLDLKAKAAKLGVIGKPLKPK